MFLMGNELKKLKRKDSPIWTELQAEKAAQAAGQLVRTGIDKVSRKHAVLLAQPSLFELDTAACRT